jgi:peptidoglycan/LPS O-acetylase OafA/YrhL
VAHDDKGAVEDAAKPAEAALAYRDWRDDQPRSRQTEIFAFAVMTALVWIGAVAGLLFFAFTMDYRGVSGPSGTLGISIAVACWATLFGMMVLLTLRWRRRPERRYLVTGIWIGFGLACLVEGICFLRLN